jgi:hypothetical protein
MLFRASLFIIVGSISGLITWWVVDRDPPVTLVKWDPVNPVVSPGDVLRIKYEYIRHRDCQTRISRFIEDSIGTRLTLTPQAEFSWTPGQIGYNTVTVPITMPRAIEQGKATYLSLREYQCNPIHWLWPIKVEGPRIHFDVKGPPLPTPLEIEQWLKRSPSQP